MRMLHTCSVIAALLTAMTVCNSTSAMMCADADDDGSTRLKKLHEYAQIAEAPKQNDLGYMEDCIDISGVVLAEKMTNVVELTVPENFIRLVRNVADNNRAILRPSQRRWNGGNSPFSVGCSAERNNENVLIDFGFKLLASIVGDLAFFFLTGTEMKGTVVVRETGERILISPGTNV